MKKFKTGLLALALVAGISGAFASKVAQAHRVLGPKYDWTDGNPANDINDVDRTDAQAHYQCNGTTVSCATGTLSPGETGPLTDEIFKF